MFKFVVRREKARRLWRPEKTDNSVLERSKEAARPDVTMKDNWESGRGHISAREG